MTQFQRIVVGVDPAMTHKAQSDETGIIVAGLGGDQLYYILDDRSGVYAPLEWAKTVAAVYHDYKCDRVVAEVNQGGDLVENTLRAVDPCLSYKGVRATRGKTLRAEPVAALYEQKRVFHRRCFPALEHQMCQFTGDPGGKSPDRLDALVWALTELALSDEAPGMPRCWVAEL